MLVAMADENCRQLFCGRSVDRGAAVRTGNTAACDPSADRRELQLQLPVGCGSLHDPLRSPVVDPRCFGSTQSPSRRAVSSHLMQSAPTQSRPSSLFAPRGATRCRRNVAGRSRPSLGDRALIAVGNVLRHHSGDTAIVARVGGEEFCIADIVSDVQINGWAEAVRNAVAAIPFGITASLGVARLPLKSLSVLGYETIDDLIATAAAAMYDAKRSGGSQIREVTATGPPPHLGQPGSAQAP